MAFANSFVQLLNKRNSLEIGLAGDGLAM